MNRTIAANPNIHISYGSEFRTVEVLEPLLHKSPLWKVVSEILEHQQFKTKIGLRESLRKENHQSAKKDP